MIVQWPRVLVCSTITILKGVRWSVVDQDTRHHLLASAHAHGTDSPPPKPLDTLIKE